MATTAPSAPTADDHILVSRSWDDLLSSQQLLVESTLAFNKAMVQKLAADRLTPPPPRQGVSDVAWLPHCCGSFPGELLHHQVVEEKDRKRNDTEEEPLVPFSVVSASPLRQPLLAGRATSSSSKGRLPGIQRVAFEQLDEETLSLQVHGSAGSSSRQESASITSDSRVARKGQLEKSKHSQKVFTLNAEDMRRRLRECFKRESVQSEENIPVGICGRIARSNFFNSFVLVIIILNSLWIAVDTDLNKSKSVWEAPYVFLLAENFFCFVFTMELIIRLGSLQSASQACEGWFLFDSSLTVMMIWDTWVSFLVEKISGHNVISSQVRSFTILRVLRILRIARVARAARIINSLPELRVLVKGMVIAMRSTCTILALLLIVVYIFAILFVQLLAESQVGQGWFENVPQAMNFLLLQTLAGADVIVINKLLAAGWTYYLLYLSFVFMGSLTLMNMLIGVLCEVVGVVAQIEEERAFHDEAQMYIANFVHVLDIDGDQKLSKVEFLQLMERDPDLLKGLQAFGIDVVAFCDNAIALFSDNDTMEVGDFVELVTQFRSQKQTTVKDLVDMRKFISMQLRHLAEEVRGRYGHSRIEAALDLTHAHAREIAAGR